MKPFRLVLIVACFSIICTLFSGVGSALEQDEIRVSPIWSNETPSPGSSVNVQIFFISDSPQELTIYNIGIHFDWMASEGFVGLNMSDNPVVVPSGGDHLFNPMIILIPEDVSVGTHSYFVGIYGLQGDYTYFTWEDPYSRTLQIQGSEEEVTNEGGDADSQQDQLLIMVGVAVVVVVVILITVLMRSRKKKKI